MQRVRLSIIGSSAAALVLAASSRILGQTTPANIETLIHVLKPAPQPPETTDVTSLKVPAGFHVSVFADGLQTARILAVSNDSVYVSRRSTGDVMLLRDEQGRGVATIKKIVARRPGMHGIAVHDRKIYLAAVKDVYVADIKSDGTLGPLTRIISDLPDAGQHNDRTLAFGPDGKLYISVGSTCNACSETSAESATLLRATPDGMSRTIFASGLRNTIGFDWHPQTHELWGMDNGIDTLGDDQQEEELNRIEQGNQYGWPYVYGRSLPMLQQDPPGGLTHEEWAKMSHEPITGYTPHAAPMQMTFYRGSQFPVEYQNDAFVAFRGSWNRKPPSGYEIVRIRFQNGRPSGFEPFLTGFLKANPDGSYAQIGRPVGVVIAADGSLLVSDDENGMIYRVSYQGGSRAPEGSPR